jgi:hypothetical protein
METLRAFSLKPHDGEYETWPLTSELLRDANPTGKRLPGYVMEAQYRCGDGRYLFVTSWDCLFEESLEIILTDADFKGVDRKSLGAMYSSTWLEHHEPVDAQRLKLLCDNRLEVVVTVGKKLKLEKRTVDPDTVPPGSGGPLPRAAVEPKRMPWWRFW